jgi:hypothetical protein
VNRVRSGDRCEARAVSGAVSGTSAEFRQEKSGVAAARGRDTKRPG